VSGRPDSAAGGAGSGAGNGGGGRALTPLSYGVWVGVFVLTIFVLHTGKDVLVPLAIAIGIWYLINAISDGFGKIRLGSLRLPGAVRLLLALGVLGAFFYFVGSLIGDSVAQVAEAAPGYREALERHADRIDEWTTLPVGEFIEDFVRNIDIAAWVSGLAAAMTTFAGTTGLIIIYVFFLLLEQQVFGEKVKALFPDRRRLSQVQKTLANIQRQIQTYLWVKTLMSVLTGGLSYGVLVWVGVDYAAFWGFIIFLLNYIPTIGSLLGIIFPVLMTLVQFDDWQPILIVAITITSFQVVIGNIIEPRVMGSSLNISPLVVMLSLVLWGTIWGVAGMFLAVPIMVILMLIFAQIEGTRPIAIALSGNGTVEVDVDSSEDG
jgi:AI-2 transport protein TqsA